MTVKKLIKNASSQGIMLLKNEDKTLPFTRDDKISIFGRCQIDCYQNESIYKPYAKNLLDSFENLQKENFPIPEIDENLIEFYKNWIKDNPLDFENKNNCQIEMPLKDCTIAIASRKSDKAVYIIGRISNKLNENSTENEKTFLTETEYENIKKLCRFFRNVTLIFNVPKIVDISWIDNAEFNGKIKAVICSCQAEMQNLAYMLCSQTSTYKKNAVVELVENKMHKEFVISTSPMTAIMPTY